MLYVIHLISKIREVMRPFFGFLYSNKCIYSHPIQKVNFSYFLPSTNAQSDPGTRKPRTVNHLSKPCGCAC